ncbi:Centrosomal protein of 164 kDa [Eumeta japonica]|uniref:Centrosomal protein of 164 kDa n=1 Tax=Eumeta variegata TaxID=151549 RepID=A0A4C1TLD9_EUMVA|nr:Centrosomal protein of 164 kDa [Eumeta japonica]
MNSPSAVVCREIFDENSQPSAEEISEYAQQLGIDPESESHLLSLAKDGLMQALPAPWKAYYDEKLQTHYYFNEETKVTQWEHPLDKVYRELVRKARDVSTHDDTCASVQELLTSEEITKHLEKMETKVDSGDEDLSMDNSEDHISDKKETQPSVFGTTRRLAPLIGRPPLAPLSKISDKKLSDLRVSSLRKNLDGTLSSKPNLTRTLTERDIPVNRILERPKLLKQQSEIIDLKMNVLTSPEEDNPPFSPLSVFKPDRGLSLTGMGNIFLKTKKTDLPSPDTEKSLPLDSMTKSDPPKGILREKLSDTFLKRSDSLIQGKSKHSMSTDEDKKSVRFKLEQAESTISPSSNSSSEQNEGQSSIVSATPVNPSSLLSSSILPSSTALPTSVLSPPVTLPSTPEMISSPPLHITSAKSRILSPLSNRPSIPPRPQIITEQILSSKEVSQKGSSSERDSIDSDGRDGRGTSPRRRVLRPPAADYIKPDLFQKNFLKISDLVRPGDIEPAPVTLEVPIEKDTRPRSPLIPQKNKISINLMESIDSETSVDSPDKEFENLDLNDLDDSKDDLVISKNSQSDMIDQKNLIPQRNFSVSEVEKYNQPTKPITEVVQVKSAKFNENQPSPQNVLPKSDILGKMQNTHSGSDESIILSHPKLSVSSKDDTISRNNSKSDAPEINLLSKSILKDKPSSQVNSTLNTVLKSPRFEVTLVPPTEVKPILSPLSSFSKPNFSIKSPMKSSDSISSISNKSPKLDAVMLSQNKSGANNNENVVVVYQFETTQDVEPVIPKYKSPLSSTDNLLRDTIQRAKAEERKKLELMLQKELEEMRVEWADKERKMRTDLIEELKQNEEKFKIEKEVRLFQQKERHRLEMDQILEEGQNNHDKMLKALSEDFTERLRRETDMAEKNHIEEMSRLREEYCKLLAEEQKRLQIENDRTLSEMRDQLATSLNTERAKLTEENRHVLESLREEHNTRISDLRHDYRAEVERLRAQHACHLEELRARLAGERARRGAADAHALADKYRCLKEKYARLKHDVKMSIERRNKRRELSMTTGSETEKSNSHKVAQSLERRKI